MDILNDYLVTQFLNHKASGLVHNPVKTNTVKKF